MKREQDSTFGNSMSENFEDQPSEDHSEGAIHYL